MPVTIKPSAHGANPVLGASAADAKDLLIKASKLTMAENLELLQSSFTENDLPMNIKPANNGFILGCVRAYNNHCHLKIRPEDVWFAILTQFVAFINAHAEDLRERFVAHEGQIMLEITSEGTRHSKVHDKFATEMAKLLDSNVVDPELRQWIMPNFSTTTKNDTVVASILMMASLQSYFKYQENFKCGFPSVTILGEKKDWELVLEKISKLETFGDEPLHFGTLLRPIISRFIRSFDDPTGPEIIDFWQRMFFRGPNGSGGQTKFSGWISAFCFWDQQGICMYAPATESHRFHDPRSGTVVQPECLQLDGISYGRANLGKIPQGWSKVPVTINDHGVEYQAQMFAGSAGYSCSSSGQPMENGGLIGLDTVAPNVSWWIFMDSNPIPNTNPRIGP